MKIRPVGSELLRVDGLLDRETSMTKLIVVSSNFTNEPQNGISLDASLSKHKFQINS